MEDRNVFKLLFLFLQPHTLLILCSSFHLQWPASQILPLKFDSHQLYSKSPPKSIITTIFKKCLSTLKWSTLPVTRAETTPEVSGFSDSSPSKRRVAWRCGPRGMAGGVGRGPSEGGFREELEALKPHQYALIVL